MFTASIPDIKSRVFPLVDRTGWKRKHVSVVCVSNDFFVDVLFHELFFCLISCSGHHPYSGYQESGVPSSGSHGLGT